MQQKTLPGYLFLALSLQCFVMGCSTTNIITQGRVEPASFYSKIDFSTAKSVILLPCTFEGETKNYLFDTGATVTGIQRDSVRGERVTVRGGSNRTTQSGSETLASFKIAEVDFVNTFATNEDMVGLKEQIPNFGGIIGRSIIDKANWLIDYPAQTIELSNRDLSDDSFVDIPLDKDQIAPHTLVEIDGKAYDAIIDLGSISTFNVPADTELAEALLARYEFTENSRSRYTVGGLERITESIGTIPVLKIGDLRFENVAVNINQSSQIRLGTRFFSTSQLYIDNTRRRYRIKPQQERFELRNVNFFQNGQFELVESVYVANGKFTFDRPDRVDTVIDLSNKFVIPPFAEGHTHQLDDPEAFDKDIRRFIDAGVFYAFVLNNRGSFVARNRATLDRLGSLEVSYANGGITYTNQHPGFAYERIGSGIAEWWLPENTEKIRNSRTLENDAYWYFDDVETVNDKWDEYLASNPDVVKIYLMNAKEGEYRGDRSISEEVAKLICEKAKAENLRVVAHIETFDDLKIGIRAGVNIFAHSPYYNVNFQEELPEQPEFSSSTLDAIRDRQIVIIPTLSFNDEFSIVRSAANNYEGAFDSTSFNRALDFQKETLRTLRAAGFSFAIGSDRDSLLLELNYWYENDLFTPAEILTIATQHTSNLIFPNRKFNAIAEGFDASFLVLDDNPLENWQTINTILLKMKDGKLIGTR